MRTGTCRFAVAAAMLACASAAHAAVVTWQMGDGQAGSAGAKDTWILSGVNGTAPTGYGDNAGVAAKLRIRTTNATNGERIVLVAFPSLIGPDAAQIPAGATITSATLRMSMAVPSVASTSIAAHQLLQDWTEGNGNWTPVAGSYYGATWNYASANSGTDVAWNTAWTVSRAVTPATFTGPIGPELSRGVGATINTIPVEDFDVTLAVQNWASGQSNFGIAMMSKEWSPAEFWSRENGTASLNPQLIVDYAIPEPTSLAMLFVGGMLVLRRKS